MIIVKLNERNFEYDIYSLVKAFFPQDKLLIRIECASSMEEAHSMKEKEQEDSVTAYIAVEYKNDRILLSYFQTDVPDAEVRSAEKDFGAECFRLVGKRIIKTVSDDRGEQKNVLKRGLYDLLQECTGKVLPWGTLTGIRPVKIPMAFLERNGQVREEASAEKEISAYMRDTYYVSEEKIKLSIEVAKEEWKLLSAVDFKQGYSLYIGIPFCPTTCLYCSFPSYPAKAWETQMDAYIDALFKEITYTAERLKHLKLQTVYIGGGTPTSLSPRQLTRLLSKLEQSFNFSHLAEYTVEAGRPDSITKEKLSVLKAFPISRISINPQTMNQKTLDLIGRKHTVEETKNSYALARAMNFENINMDIILGLPGEAKEEVAHTLEEIKQLNPDSLTVHSLAVKRAAGLGAFQEERKLSLWNTKELVRAAADAAKAMDMRPYYLYRQKNMAGNFENTGYAKSGKAGLYNVLIMEEKQHIIALGAGAITKYVSHDRSRIERSDNVKDVTHYLNRIDEMIDRKKRFYRKILEAQS